MILVLSKKSFIIWIIFLHESHYTEGSRALLSKFFEFSISLESFSNSFESINFLINGSSINLFESFFWFIFFLSWGFFLFLAGENSFTCKNLSSSKLIEIIFKIWSLGWMTFEHYGTILVNEHHMRNT